jgi:Fe2+ or Zn2+ uptake regulation protein
VNQAMKLYNNVEMGFVKLVKTSKKLDKSFISDNKGQISSIDSNKLYESIEYLKSSVNDLKMDIKVIKNSTIQSKLNIVSKSVGKVRNVINGTVKSAKREAKLDKSVKILENVMKWNEHDFTVKEYQQSLARIEGQGDPRTARSDLAILESAGRVKKVRSNAHGTETYQFTENDQYHKYNTDLAKTKFLEDFEEAHQNQDAFTVNDLNMFISEKHGLYDAKSQYKRLKWLIDEGLVKRHEVNPKLLLIQK